MEYFDVWKKMMGVDNTTQAVVNNGKELAIREFANDPSYRKAVLQKLDLTKEDIDIRIKNVDRTTAQKRILFLPDTEIEVGSYISYREKTFLITEFQDDQDIAPYSTAKFCNQTLNWKGLEKPIPCVAEDSAYNDKGEINLDYFSMVDGKLAIYVPVNEITNKIKQNMRFVFNHNSMMVFEIISIKNVTTPTIYKIVMKKVEYFEGKDDLENNIAYNDDILDKDKPTIEPSIGYEIVSSLGTFDIRQYGASTFTIMRDSEPDTEEWSITLDYNGVSTSHIKVESQTSNSIKIRNLKGVSENKLKLTFVKGDISINQEVGVIK